MVLSPPPSSIVLKPLPYTMVPHHLPCTVVLKPLPSAVVRRPLPSSMVLHGCRCLCHQAEDRGGIQHLQVPARASLQGSPRGSGQGRQDIIVMLEWEEASATQSVPASPPCRPGGRAVRGAAGEAESWAPTCHGARGPTAMTQPCGCRRSPPAPRLPLLLGASCRSPRR